VPGIKRTTADAHFSDCVRIRVNFTCEKCGIYIPEGERKNAQCAHIIGRKHKSTRHDPDNALCLCGGCHSEFTDDPLYFSRWVDLYLGSGLYELLQEKKNRIMKKYKGEEKEKAKHYLSEKKRMQKLRDEGEQGRIEFVGFY
jgi:hypothetical protein